MSGIFDKMREIVAMSISIEEKEEKLREIGLTEKEISQALYYERFKQQQEADRLRKEKRLASMRSHESKKTGSPSMKCLAIRQPWATLVVAGIKDVELRTAMVPPTSKFLIAASATRDGKCLEDIMNDEELSIVEPYLASGALPPYEEWPTSAIIGWVELDRVTYDEVDSPWARGYDGIKYVIKKAHMFKEPIRGKNKATPFFYNVEGIDEDNMPEVMDIKLGK